METKVTGLSLFGCTAVIGVIYIIILSTIYINGIINMIQFGMVFIISIPIFSTVLWVIDRFTRFKWDFKGGGEYD